MSEALAGAGGSSGTGGTAGSATQCAPTNGGNCTAAACCNATACVQGACAGVCSKPNDCITGCCSGGVCAPLGLCEAPVPACIDVGEDCSTRDCCSGSTCVTADEVNYVCAADCLQDAECGSGCCADLEGGGAVCAPADFCAPPPTLSLQQWCVSIAGEQCDDLEQCFGSAPSNCLLDAYESCCPSGCSESSGKSLSDLSDCVADLAARSCGALGTVPISCTL
jgi:hypothetical protein